MIARKDRSAILDALVEAGVIDEAGARRAAQVARSGGESVVAVIHQLALADDTRVLEILSARFETPVANDADVPTTAVEAPGVSAAYLRRHRVLPLGWAGDRLLAGIIDPENSDGLAALAFAAGRATEPRLMTPSAQKRAFDALYGAGDGEIGAEPATAPLSVWSDDAARVRDHADAAPAVRLVDAVLERAIDLGASDIHIEPMPDRVRIRLRVDGVLHVEREEPAHLAAPIAARIKILADMDVADRRRPQDGRTSLAAHGRPVDVRISTVPSAHGETVALRLLRREAALLDLAGLGFSAQMRALFEEVLGLRRGVFLMTGPTGSGKTTTLYAMIDRLRRNALKILSVEDPVEYFFPDVTQTQVNEDAGVTFAAALRAFLRQDPDVILVGEIRDSETARIAVQAALTGHLVLATLHTSDAPGAVARLVDMGVDRFLVADTLAAVASQRLVRKLCPHCRTPRAPNAMERAILAPHLATDAVIEVADANGCSICKGSGFSGRLAVGEGFRMTDAVRTAIADPSGAALDQTIAAAGFQPILRAAAACAARAEITIADFRALGLA
ncbi:MAG: proteinral secretion pathway protein E [Caulobacteraceae bacterium]|nr:MAG: proteinral secretion pathway protein E [Caulobacteraceae bacterium]